MKDLLFHFLQLALWSNKISEMFQIEDKMISDVDGDEDAKVKRTTCSKDDVMVGAAREMRCKFRV